MSDPKMCVWCGEPATEQVTVEPARYRKTMVVDPQSGSRIPGQQLIQAAIVVDVCAARAQRITESGTPPPISDSAKARHRTDNDLRRPQRLGSRVMA